MAGDKTANAGTTEGFAEFLTRKGFNLYKSGTMENQGDVDTYEGDGNFLSLLNESLLLNMEHQRAMLYPLGTLLLHLVLPDGPQTSSPHNTNQHMR